MAPLAMGLARLLREAEEMPAGPERHKLILEVARQLSQLRRDSLLAERVRIERDRWEEKLSEICQREHQEAEQAARSEVIMQQTMKEFPHLRFGLRRKEAENSPAEPPVRPKRKARGERPVAEAASKDGQKETKGTEWTKGTKASGSRPIKPIQAQSNQIKPNQTCPREKWTCRRARRDEL